VPFGREIVGDTRHWFFGRARLKPCPAEVIILLCQLTWKILPGLRGLSCSDFRATATQSPETEKGVAIDFSSESERDALLVELETRFAAERFSNSASAFETVKAYVLDRAANRTGSM